MFQSNRLTKLLNIKHPIIQGPFGGNLSTVDLVSAVSNAGGLGSYGAHILAPEEIKKLISNIRNATANPFAINLWVSNYDDGFASMSEAQFEMYLEPFKPFYDELKIDYPVYPETFYENFEDQVDALMELSPPVFSFVFGVPDEAILKECKKRKILTIGAATTVDEAIALSDAGVDIILATGFEAGGHRVAFQKPAEQSLIGTLALVPQVVDAVPQPVIAAGGISDARGIKAALALGAEAAQLGTAFLACSESGTSDLHRQSLFNNKAENTVLSRSFTGRLARFIPNEFILQCESCPELPLPFPIQSFFASPLKLAAAKTSTMKFTSHYAGQGTGLLKHRSAFDLMDQLITDLSN